MESLSLVNLCADKVLDQIRDSEHILQDLLSMKASNDLIRSLLKEKRIKKVVPKITLYYKITLGDLSENDDGSEAYEGAEVEISSNPPIVPSNMWSSMEIEFDIRRKVIRGSGIYYLISLEWDGQLDLKIQQMEETGDITDLDFSTDNWTVIPSLNCKFLLIEEFIVNK